MSTALEAIYQKLPYRGMFVGESLQAYLGKHGGFIADGTLKNYTRKLSDEDRHIFAETFGLVRHVRANGKLQWNSDLQTDQTIAARTRRVNEECCPIHGVPFYQTSSWGYIDEDGDFHEGQEEPTCSHCPHCATKVEKPCVCVATCLVCPVSAFVGGSHAAVLLPEFNHLLKVESEAVTSATV